MTAPRAAILLSTFNGARFLPAQLDSFTRQTVPWCLFWRDDGSSDETVALMEEFAAGAGAGRCRRVGDGRLGVSGSFYALLRAAAPSGLPVAFSDQDDVWLPERLARGLAAVGGLAAPALYCTTQLLVDEALRPMALSVDLPRRPGFPAALTSNIATGCTVLLNAAAAALVAGSAPPAGPLHDWWSYALVSACGGTVIADPVPMVLYRQHGANAVGAPRTRRQRAMAALRRGQGAYLGMLRALVAALLAAPPVTPEARAALAVIDRGLRGGVLDRLRALAVPGLRRHTAIETLLFRWWFLKG